MPSRAGRGQGPRAELKGTLHRANIVLVAGTRPEAIKLPPVFRSLRDCGHHPSLILTGQHPIEAADYGFAALRCAGWTFRTTRFPSSRHNWWAQCSGSCWRESTSLSSRATRPAPLPERPAHGMPASPLPMSRRGSVRINPEAPRPEEGFRIAIDAMADLLFAPTEYSAANLRRERVAGIVHITGNNAVDALLTLRPGRQARISDRQVQRLLVTCHRRENWEHGISGIATALRRIAETKNVAIKLLLHPNPAIAQALRGWLSWHVAARGSEDRLRLAV